MSDLSQPSRPNPIRLPPRPHHDHDHDHSTNSTPPLPPHAPLLIKVVVKSKCKFIARLCLDGPSAGTEALNLSLFATADDAPDLLPSGASPIGGAQGGGDAPRQSHEQAKLSQYVVNNIYHPVLTALYLLAPSKSPHVH